MNHGNIWNAKLTLCATPKIHTGTELFFSQFLFLFLSWTDHVNLRSLFRLYCAPTIAFVTERYFVPTLSEQLKYNSVVVKRWDFEIFKLAATKLLRINMLHEVHQMSIYYSLVTIFLLSWVACDFHWNFATGCASLKTDVTCNYVTRFIISKPF